jgi:ParB family transcriptional regulator, chromosome partitioning protein
MNTTPKNQLIYLPVEQLQRGKYQPRKHFDPEALDELAASIKVHGIIEPIIVRRMDDQYYEIIAGERRWRAAQLARLDSVPCVVRQCHDDQAAELTIIENIQREDLNAIEEAKAYQRLVDEFKYVHEEVAQVVGKSRAKITNTLRLLNLDERVQSMIKTSELSGAHGKALASLPLKEQVLIAQKAIQQDWSVRRLEKTVKSLKSDAPLCSDNDPNVKHLEQRLSEKLGSKVGVVYDKNGKGQLVIHFSRYDIFEGILDKMGCKEDDFK